MKISKIFKKVVEKKVDFFENFRNFQYFNFFENIFFIEKVNIFRKFSFFIFLSYLMPNPCEWHRATPSVPPVDAANAIPKIRKIQKACIFFVNCIDLAQIMLGHGQNQ